MGSQRGDIILRMDDLMEELAEAYHELQQAHIMFEGMLVDAKDFTLRFDELKAAARRYNKAIYEIDQQRKREAAE